VEEVEGLKKAIELALCGAFSRRVARRLAEFDAAYVAELQKKGFTKEEAMELLKERLRGSLGKGWVRLGGDKE
jgi:hypothetical protein